VPSRVVGKGKSTRQFVVDGLIFSILHTSLLALGNVFSVRNKCDVCLSQKPFQSARNKTARI